MQRSKTSSHSYYKFSHQKDPQNFAKEFTIFHFYQTFCLFTLKVGILMGLLTLIE